MLILHESHARILKPHAQAPQNGIRFVLGEGFPLFELEFLSKLNEAIMLMSVVIHSFMVDIMMYISRLFLLTVT